MGDISRAADENLSPLAELTSWPELGSSGHRVSKSPEEKQVKASPSKEAQTSSKSNTTPTKKELTYDISQSVLVAVSNKMKTTQLKKTKKLKKNLASSSGPLEVIKKKGKVREVPKVRVSRIKKAVRMVREHDPASDENEWNKQLEKAKTALVLSVKKTSGSSATEEEISFIPDDQEKDIKVLLHSKRFRAYCTNMRNDQLQDCAFNLIKCLREFQDNMYQRNPAKARIRKRFVCGFNEVRKFVRCGDAKLVLIAMDMERDPVHCMVCELSKTAKDSHIPLVFVGSRRELGTWTKKKSAISTIGVLNYQGAEEHFNKLIPLWEKAKNDYCDKLKEIGEKMFTKTSPVDVDEAEEKLAPELEIQEKIINLLRDSTSPKTAPTTD